jgi:hypothetical protein
MTDKITFTPFSQIIGQERAIKFLKPEDQKKRGVEISLHCLVYGRPGIGIYSL